MADRGTGRGPRRPGSNGRRFRPGPSAAETVLFPEAYRRFGWALSQCKAARLRVYVEWDETESGLSLIVTDALTEDEERN